jgi:hypothetical protein
MNDPIPCPKCGSDKTSKAGIKRGRQMIQCKTCRRYSIMVERAGPLPAPPAQAPGAGFVTLAQVIEKYDVAAAIRREIAQLPKGRLLLEQELFQRTAGTDRSRFRRTVENNAEAFRPFRIKLRLERDEEPKWYWADPDTIGKAMKLVEG